MNAYLAVTSYNTLVQSPRVRELISKLVVDFTNESIDRAKSLEAFERLNINEWKNELFNIRGFLEGLSYSCRQVDVKWWWNYGHRVEKLTFVAMCLERLNYLSMSGARNPAPLNLPSYVIAITDHLDMLRAEGGFERWRVEHLHLFNSNSFYRIYTEGKVVTNADAAITDN